MTEKVISNKELDMLYNITSKSLKSGFNLTMGYYENQYKMYDELIQIHLKHEPLKIFKKSYKKWEDELHELNDKHNEAYLNFFKEYEELCDLEQL